MYRMFFLFLPFLFFECSTFASETSVAGKTIVYHEQQGPNVVVYTHGIYPLASGFRIGISSAIGKSLLTKSETTTDENYRTLTWNYFDVKEKINVQGQRVGRTIMITGTKQGKPIDEKFAIDDRPWLQLFPYGLEDFAKSSVATTQFWAVNPSRSLCALFNADRQEMGTLRSTQGKEYSAIHLRIGLAGMLSLFWSADYWLSVSDGLQIQAKGAFGPPGTAVTVVKIQKED